MSTKYFYHAPYNDLLYEKIIIFHKIINQFKLRNWYLREPVKEKEKDDVSEQPIFIITAIAGILLKSQDVYCFQYNSSHDTE